MFTWCYGNSAKLKSRTEYKRYSLRNAGNFGRKVFSIRIPDDGGGNNNAYVDIDDNIARFVEARRDNSCYLSARFSQ